MRNDFINFNLQRDIELMGNSNTNDRKVVDDKFIKFLDSEMTPLGMSDKKTIERVKWYYETYFKPQNQALPLTDDELDGVLQNFADFLIGDFEMITDKADDLLWQLGGTNQNYDAKGIVEFYKNDPMGLKQAMHKANRGSGFTLEDIEKAWNAADAHAAEMEQYPYGRHGGYKTPHKEQYLKQLSISKYE